MSDDDVSAEIRSVVTDVLEKGPEDVEASWLACAEAGLLGLAAPSALGGEALGLPELAVLVREVARRARDLPLRETLVCGLLPLVANASPELQESLVPRIASGELVVAPALNEPGAALPLAPATRFDGECVTGRKLAVPLYDDLPGRETILLVSATSDHGAVVVLVDPDGDGVSSTETPASRGRVEATYVFDGAPVLGVLGEGAAEAVRSSTVAGLLLHADGLLAGALDLTAGYIKERSQ